MTDIVEEMAKAIAGAQWDRACSALGIPNSPRGGNWSALLPEAQAAYTIVERRIGELTEAARFAHTTLVEQQVARIARQELRAGGLADKISAVVNKLRASLEQRSDQ
jgi:hypothetical protein